VPLHGDRRAAHRAVGALTEPRREGTLRQMTWLKSVRSLVDSSADLANAVRLRERLERDGYLFFRGLMPQVVLEDLRGQILAVVEEAGWLDRHAPREHAVANMNAACVEPQPEFRRVYNRLWKLAALHRLSHHPRLLQLIGNLTGPVLAHPRPILRVMFPQPSSGEDFTTPPHQDFPHIQGTPETFTTWISLADCPMAQGPLAVAEGSHRKGVYDFKLASGAGAIEVVDPLTDLWRASDLLQGDVLLFHSMTVHRGVPNRTESLRISVDYRYQSAAAPINEECLSLNERPMAEEGARFTWERLYAEWDAKGAVTDDLKYHWKRFDLRVVPRDPQYHNRRDELALEAAASGDARAISTLQRIIEFTPLDSLRERAAELIARFDPERRAVQDRP